MTRPSFTVKVGNYDLTLEAENVSYSNVDPGGCEIATFDLKPTQAQIVRPGDRVRIFDGVKCVWDGRVAEPAKAIKHGLAAHRRIGIQTTHISCEGAGAALKDNDYSYIYVDRDVGRWSIGTVARQIVLTQSDYEINQLGWQSSQDPNGNGPALVFTATGQITGRPIGEAWYDAGPLNRVNVVKVGGFGYYHSVSATEPSFGGVGLLPWAFLMTDTAGDVDTQIGHLTSYGANALNAWALSSGLGGTRWAALQVVANAAADTGATGTSGESYTYTIPDIRVYGPHGLALRNDGSAWGGEGLYAVDIASHAIAQGIASGAKIRAGRFDTSPFVVTHYVQYEPVQHEQVLDDMSKLAVMHYGTWPSDSFMDDTPICVMVNRPLTATHFTSLNDCDEADLTERLADLYTKALITWTDGAGTENISAVSLPNALLDQVGITRTNTISLGTASAASATVFATFALQALFAQSRTAGSLILPKAIRNSSGAAVPSHWLRAGLDRLRVADLPYRAGLISSSDTDSFRISRIEVQIDPVTQAPTTRVEVDNGPDLLESLQARLGITSQIRSIGI